MGWNAATSLQVYQEFWALGNFWIKDQDVNRNNQYCMIVYLLDFEAWNSFTREHPTDKKDPYKVFDKFEMSFHTHYVQRSYKEEATSLSSRTMTQ